MARTRTKRLANMDRAQLMNTAESVSAKRYPMESGRISEGRATLLGLFNLEMPAWIIEIHETTVPHYVCLTQRGPDVFCHTIAGEGEIDWRLWMGDHMPSTTNAGDHPETFRNYHKQAVTLHEQPSEPRRTDPHSRSHDHRADREYPSL